MTRLLSILAVLLVLVLPGRADVFTLWPGSDKATVRDALRAKAVLTEPMLVNGQAGTLEVSLSDLAGQDLSTALKALLKDYKSTGQGGTTMLESAPRDGMVTRHLIITSAVAGQKTVIFTMDVPLVKPTEDLRQAWPKSLPEPLGGRIESVMVLKARGTVYGTFATGNTAAQSFASYDAQLRGQGWRLLAGDAQAGASYMSADGKRMLVISTSDHDGGSRGAIYAHDVK